MYVLGSVQACNTVKITLFGRFGTYSITPRAVNFRIQYSAAVIRCSVCFCDVFVALEQHEDTVSSSNGFSRARCKRYIQLKI